MDVMLGGGGGGRVVLTLKWDRDVLLQIFKLGP